jgi:hypothetical protein
MQGLSGPFLLLGPLRAAWFLGGHEELDLGQRARQEAPSRPSPTPGRSGGRRRGGDALVMDATAVRGPEDEDEEPRIPSQDGVDGVVFFLAALPRGRWRRGLRAAAPPGRAVMGQRGDAGPVAPGLGAAASGTTMGAAAAAAPPRRGAKTVRERAGAAPRARSAARSTGHRTWSPCWAVLWPMPTRRPCPPGRRDVFPSPSIHSRRSSGVGSGQGFSTLNGRAVRGVPSRRPAALCAWNAGSKGGTSWGNSSRVRLGQSRHSVGRDCRAANPLLAMRDASLHGRHRIS